MNSFEARLRSALLAGRRPGHRGSGAASLRRNDGYEFAELREYVESDDFRRIDWAATARAGALQTRVMLEERALFLGVAIDASHSMQVGRTVSNYDLACETAALWFSAAIDDDRCARLGDEALVLRDVRGRAGALACTTRRETPGTDFQRALGLAIATLPKGTRLLIASDFYDLDAMQPLVLACAARFDLTALVVRDPWHAGLPLSGFVRMRDAETGRAERVYIDRAARARLRDAVARREAGVVERLRAFGARAGTLDEASGSRRALEETLAI